jgi:hypothetical protein
MVERKAVDEKNDGSAPGVKQGKRNAVDVNRTNSAHRPIPFPTIASDECPRKPTTR